MKHRGGFEFGGSNENPSEPSANIPAGAGIGLGLFAAEPASAQYACPYVLLLLSRLGLRGGLPLSPYGYYPGYNAFGGFFFDGFRGDRFHHDGEHHERFHDHGGFHDHGESHGHDGRR